MQGDHATFVLLYDHYWKPLFREAMAILRDQADAEDCIQELFVSIWKRRESLQLRTNLGAYLHSAVRYSSIHMIERNITRENRLQSLSDWLAQPVPSVQDLMQANELKEQIDRIVHELPEKMREVFELSRRQQLSYKEIAAQLGISEETVKKQVYNALKLLRSHLNHLPFLLFYCGIYLPCNWL